MALIPLSRRRFIRGLGATTLGLALPGSLWCKEPTSLGLFIGTYTNGSSEGIYHGRLNLENGAMTDLTLAAPATNPSFLALHPGGSFLYAVGEAGGGSVSAFAIDGPSGALTLLNSQSTHGGGPCHLSVDPSGQWVAVANYGGGSLALLPLTAEGPLKAATHVVQHQGQGADPRRQRGPHAHCVMPDAAGRFIFAADLGLDKVLAYHLDRDQGRLDPHPTTPWVALSPGAGPRHFTFHPNGRFAYVVNEFDSSVTALSYDPDSGALQALQTVSALPASYAETSYGADIHLRPDGRFLYASNRGHDSIAVFSVDAQTGLLTAQGHASTLGHWPRNFTIDPSGAFLLVANQRSNSVVSFRIDPTSGALSPTGHTLDVGAPVCLQWGP
ncbi:MAG: beta-propeller fold lactonase family protein [Candidatus Latescibacteria bacterium]|nr:beta-propeller fold lactonase family protein [Candidatus Latescibacterota bacterium]